MDVFSQLKGTLAMQDSAGSMAWREPVAKILEVCDADWH